MGTKAKIPQQRIRAPKNHPTIDKLEQLFDYMDDLGIDLEYKHGRILVSDRDRPKDKSWDIRDIVNSVYLFALPCHVGEYKLTRQVNIPARIAQPAPDVPVTPVKVKASGLNHFKQNKKKKIKSKIIQGLNLGAIFPGGGYPS